MYIYICIYIFPQSSSIFLPISILGWNELLIASFSHRSIAVKDGILLATGLHVHRNSAHSAGVGAIFDRSVLPTLLHCSSYDVETNPTANCCYLFLIKHS